MLNKILDLVAYRIPTAWWRLSETEGRRFNPPPDLPTFNHEWLPMGHCPTPTNERQWFVHHLCMGLLMRYPTHKVIWYSIINIGHFRALEISLKEDLQRIINGEEPIYLIRNPERERETE